MLVFLSTAHANLGLLSKYLRKGQIKVLKEFVFSFSRYILLHRWKKIGHFSSHFHTSSNFFALITWYVMHQSILAYGICCSTHFTIEIIRELVMSLQVIINVKQNDTQMATFAAPGTRADIDDLRCRSWEQGRVPSRSNRCLR